MTKNNPFEEDKQLKMIENAAKAIIEKQEEQSRLIQQAGKALVDCQNLQLQYLAKISYNVRTTGFIMAISFILGWIAAFFIIFY